MTTSLSYNKLVEVRLVDSMENPDITRVNNFRNYGFGFTAKVASVLLISCVIIAFQVAITFSSKNETQKDVSNLIRHLQLQSESQQSKSRNQESESEEPQQVSLPICKSCGSSSVEAEMEAEAIRQIANEERLDELRKMNGDFSIDKDDDNKDHVLNKYPDNNDNDNGILQLSKPVITATINGENNQIINNKNNGDHDSGEVANLKTITTTTTRTTNTFNANINTNNLSAKESQSSEILDNVFFSVKSSKRFHKSRLEPVLKTWFNLAKEQTWIFTDDDDPELTEKTNGHMVNTNCPSTHYRQALCCKMAAEFDAFIQTAKSWFCHFDDDNYVNVPVLLEMLGKYDPREYWYLGKPSLKSPIRIRNPDNHTDEVSFWFATGGAGFCLSRALALRMSPLASGGKFTKICDRIQLPDDVTVGYIAGHLLGQKLTVVPQFHSHFETMKFIDMKHPSSEITFSYVRYPEYENILEVEGFSEKEDPTRFLSLHCRLFPNFSFCQKSSQSQNTAKNNNNRISRRNRTKS